MKKFTLSFMWCLGIGISTCMAQAQGQQTEPMVCVFCANNMSEQPSWGPAGYDYVYYYYFPDIELYYYVPDHQFIYQRQGAWIVSTSLPLKYAVFDFYKAYKVVINDYMPYLQHEMVKITYAAYKGKHGQPVNRDDEAFKKAREAEREKAKAKPVYATSLQ